MADSYIAQELENILGAQNELDAPRSRIAKILMKMLDPETEIEAPQSVIGDLLYQIYEQGGGGGGSSALDEFIAGTTTTIKSDAEIVRQYCFNYYLYGSGNLFEVNFPKAKSIESYSFQRVQMSKADFGALTSIKGSAFNNGTLDNLIIRTPSVCAVTSSSFQNSNWASGGKGGNLYVPSAVIDSYKNDMNWRVVIYSNPKNTINTIEGSIYE